MQRFKLNSEVDVELVDHVGNVEQHRGIVVAVDEFVEVNVDNRTWRVNTDSLTSKFVNGRCCRIVSTEVRLANATVELLHRNIFRVNAVDDPVVAAKILKLIGVNVD